MDVARSPGPVRMSVDGTRLGLHPSGPLDLETISALTTAIETAAHVRPESITIDLSDVTFIDSSGLRVLVRAYRRSRREGFSLSVVAGNPIVSRALALTGLTRLFDAQPDDVGPAAAAV